MHQLIEQVLDQLTFLEPLADSLQKTFGQLLEQGGETAKLAKDALNGVWFEHPLHPAMTDIPIGAWTCSTMLDLASAGDERMAKAADVLVAVGCAGAVGAAITGLADWQDTYGKERRTGLAHALLNSGALALFLTSLSLRRSGARFPGILASLTGYGLALGSAYLGGDLVFRMGTQVNRTAWIQGPDDWTAAIADGDVPEGKLVRASAGEVPVLLCRQNGRLHAISAVCPHAGGPLDEGTLEGRTVTCPWHGSQFDLADGTIVHGPSSVRPPLYDTRVENGQIEVKRRAQ
ncbi:MAG TPA: Rieske 2Fe-2S domain-containing protein [Chloroflexota bacterium]|nr:Rieske 2Fe-2S domain-containing protein [Chloroflexota bacterium]